MNAGFYSAAQVSGITTFSVVQIRRLVRRGEFPPPVRLSEKRVAWSRSDVDDWVTSKLRRPRDLRTKGEATS